MPANVTRRYLAVCDVLGFSELVKKSTLDSLYARFEELLGVVQAHCHHQIWQLDVHSLNDPGPIDIGTIEIEHTIFSDTILLWSEAVSDEIPWDMAGFNPFFPGSMFFNVLCRLIPEGLRCGLPLRIGVAFGEVAIDRTRGVYLGIPLVHAHELELAQEWVGCACHPSCAEAPGNKQLRDDPFSFGNMVLHRDLGPIIKYTVPMKASTSIDAVPWALDWPYWSKPEVETMLEEGRRRAEPYEPAVRKWHNALLFYRSRITLWEATGVRMPFRSGGKGADV